jgi:hypothetical protein
MRLNSFLVFKEFAPKQSCKFILLTVTMALAFLTIGCNSVQQSAASPSPSSTQSISLPPALLPGNLGASYQAVLSVSGGRSPYEFYVNQGKLPPGLTLNTVTGNISGTPTQPGNFTFIISVSGGGSGTHSYTLTVDSCLKCVAVQISPADPSVPAGGSVQFSASVTNASNPAVTWSASAGTISPTGLFTAPSNPTVKTITVTASSVAQAGAYASTTGTISSSTLAITTTSVPSAVQSQSYSQPISATGGQAPYQWSIASGSLPGGLQMSSSTGTLSGSAAQTGTFNFTVTAKDAASHSAQQSLSLLVTSSVACGPPVYCSRTDFDIVPVPSQLPKVGKLVGANTIVTDPNFGNRIVRITDANTDTATGFVNRTYETTASGSADENIWNLDSTLFVVQDTGAGGYLFTFNPATMQAARMYVSSFPTTNGMKVSGGGVWSHVNSDLLYSNSGTAISSYNFTDRTNPPSPQNVYDFTSSPNCLPAGFMPTWQTRGGVSADDTVFGMGYSNTGAQNTGIYAAVYKVGSGCSMLNTQTGQVSGDWGVKSALTRADRFTVHNVKVSKDGNWLIIAKGNCLISSCSTGPYFWQIGTTNMISCGDGGHCSGHWTEGYTHWVNNNGSPTGNQETRLLSLASSAVSLTPVLPTGFTGPADQHQSWNNVDPADSAPFATTTWSQTTPFTAPWYNEILGIAADGSGTIWRFAHSFNSGTSQNFTTQYAIGSISQDGKYFIFSSDWMGTLGSESGSTTCSIGTDCRGDVFVVELK